MIRNISLKVCERSGRTLFSSAPPVSFRKTTGFFGGIADIHGFHQEPPFYLNRLSKNQAWYDR